MQGGSDCGSILTEIVTFNINTAEIFSIHQILSFSSHLRTWKIIFSIQKYQVLCTVEKKSFKIPSLLPIRHILKEIIGNILIKIKLYLKAFFKDCSINLCLFFCSAYRVIINIFLNSIYMCYYIVMVFIFLAYFTLYNGLRFISMYDKIHYK